MHSIVFVLIFLISGFSALLKIVLYPNIKNIFLNKAINNDYLDKVMNKIKNEFSSNNNIYLKQKSNYPKEIQDIINDVMKELTSEKKLATYFDVINLYEKFKNAMDKDNQNKAVGKYIM